MATTEQIAAMEEERKRCGRAEARCHHEGEPIAQTYWEGRRDGLQEALRILQRSGYAEEVER